MDWLNYHHLYYFWTVARRGTIAAASTELRLTQPTISAQLKALEDSLGVRLFERDGRRLKLSDAGKAVFSYAEQIFNLGKELSAALRGPINSVSAKLNIGVADVVPKLIACHLLQPALTGPERFRLYCKEDTTERLLAELALHNLDMVISDRPLPEGFSVKAYSHSLGESSLAFFASVKLKSKFKKAFPKSLNQAPLLLPSKEAAVRHQLDQWIDDNELNPEIVAEFDDSALLKSFGREGHGVFVAPSVLSAEICKQYGAVVLGRVSKLKERFYAITSERRITHPGVRAVSQRASRLLNRT